VRKVIEPILYSEAETSNLDLDDLKYVEDLGLITKKNKHYEISNAIYKEIIPRELVYTTQHTIAENELWYIENNRLNMPKLLKRFQEFYRMNVDVWLEKFAYKEAGPHLLLMAFLQRIINGGGTIDREYGFGRRRIDLFITFGEQKICIETKINRYEKTREEGIKQLTEYMNICGASEGHLILFDKTNKPWDEKIYSEKINDMITLWGM